ncbi:IclR family transcriptional regulator C-terminal domain-containing protein [Streptomyces sp. NPDC058637]|uniref:IclR family transcriptional regulator domain-containing protein n=1 Tax=Streptomyces sp. NPDC058637 TaxID=3346569 RepID=UPI003653001B
MTSRPLAHDGSRRHSVGTAVRDGYALVGQGLEEGLRSVALSLRDRAGRVVATLDIAPHSGRWTPQEIRDRVLRTLRDTAARIEVDLAVASGRAPLTVRRAGGGADPSPVP